MYAEYVPRIYNFFRYRVGDDALAEDLTAHTFEKAWRARGRYRQHVAALSTWLFSIARNVAIDHGRRQHGDEPLDAACDQPGAGSPEDEVQRRADVARLSALLATLSPRDRELIALKYGAECIGSRSLGHCLFAACIEHTHKFFGELRS